MLANNFPQCRQHFRCGSDQAGIGFGLYFRVRNCTRHKLFFIIDYIDNPI